jgi:hypothetical protein
MNLGTEQLEVGLAKFQKLPRAYRMTAYPVIAALVVVFYSSSRSFRGPTAWPPIR